MAKPHLRLISHHLPKHVFAKNDDYEAGASAKLTRTILVVEDEVLIRVVAADYLRELGYHVIEAQDAASAKKVLEAEDVDLLFTDVRMPGQMDGLELAKWVRAQFPLIQVIVASGYVGKNSYRNEYGPFLEKPYTVTELEAQIASLLG